MHFRLIGDPHITRKFILGVPPHRRGEREQLLFDDFEQRLYEGDEKMIIVVGDLFEKPLCTMLDLTKTITILDRACRSQPDREIIIISGNHDMPQAVGDACAFKVIQKFSEFVPNLWIFTEPAVHRRVALFPWEWTRTAEEQLRDVEGEEFDYAVGHWDLVAYDGMHKDHLCPAKQLKQMGAREIISGHWHIAGDYKVAGEIVHCTGSMQPMTHAEDPEATLYVTMNYEEYMAADQDSLKDKYVRLRLDGDEMPPAPRDCLGFKVEKKAKPSETTEVSLDGFNLLEVVTETLIKFEVPKKLQKKVKEKLDVVD